MTTNFTAKVLFSGPVPAALPPLEGVQITAVSSPLASDALAPALAGAWYWPEAAAAVASHGSHLDVSLPAGEGPATARALVLTRALAALAAQPGAAAVLWEATSLLHAPDAWCAQAEDAGEQDLPILLWIAFDGTEDDAGARTLSTRGLSGFGVLEVEVPSSRRDGEEVLEIVCDVALVALASAGPLEDGEPVEVTRGEVRVRVAPSLRGDGSKAYRLRLP